MHDGAQFVHVLFSTESATFQCELSKKQVNSYHAKQIKKERDAVHYVILRLKTGSAVVNTGSEWDELALPVLEGAKHVLHFLQSFWWRPRFAPKGFSGQKVTSHSASQDPVVDELLLGLRPPERLPLPAGTKASARKKVKQLLVEWKIACANMPNMCPICIHCSLPASTEVAGIPPTVLLGCHVKKPVEPGPCWTQLPKGHHFPWPRPA